MLQEALAERICRATVHAKRDLLSGFTTLRDLGTEGSGYADVGIKSAIEKRLVPGPRMLVVTRAIVASGADAPRGFAPEWRIPQGAEEADGETLRAVVRRQIRAGADWIKVYADFPYGPDGKARPAFSLEELRLIDRGGGRPHGRHHRPPQGPAGDEGRRALQAILSPRGIRPVFGGGDPCYDRSFGAWVLVSTRIHLGRRGVETP